MKKLDQFSRRLIIAAISISIILLSSSVFIVSLKSITAVHAKEYEVPDKLISETGLPGHLLKNSPNQDDPEEDIRAIYAFGIGIRDGNLYFGILYSNNTVGLHLAPADGEDVLEW